MMHANKVFAMAFATALTGATTGCGSDTADAPTKGKKAAWSCEINGASQVVCSTAQASTMAPAPAYACTAGEASAQCPDEQTVQNVPGLADAIGQGDTAGAFKSNPWACLVTGKEQIQCTRSCGKPTTDAAPGAAGVETGGDGAFDFDNAPALPESCETTAWEPYFALLASHQYHLSGVDIVFPREIFDASQSFLGIIPELSGILPGGAAMSCNLGEVSTRSQAWLNAVSQGCTNLAVPILVLCQQAAEFAPTTGKCTATGTW